MEAFQKFRSILEKDGDIEEKTSAHLMLMEQFYADDIIQVENSENPIQGKDKLIALERKNLKGVYSINTKFDNVIIDEKQGIVWGEMILNFHSKKAGKILLEEAFIQKWNNDEIYFQRFFYGRMAQKDKKP